MGVLQEIPSGPAGRRAALHEVARGCHGRLLRCARRITRNPEDAEEVVQEALLKAFQNVEQFRGDAALSSWLFRITVNQALLFLRAKHPQPLPLDDAEAEWKPINTLKSGDRTPEEICAASEMAGRVRECLNRIGPKYRRVLSMRALDEKTHEEIAEELDLTVELVRVRLHRARRQIRQMLAPSLASFYQRKAA